MYGIAFQICQILLDSTDTNKKEGKGGRPINPNVYWRAGPIVKCNKEMVVPIYGGRCGGDNDYNFANLLNQNGSYHAGI